MGWLRTSVASGAPSAISGAPHDRHRNSSRRGRGPRAGLAALALILLAPAGAIAADMPDFLRGSYTPTSGRWDGINVGVQVGASNMNADFGNSTSGLIAYILRNTEVQDQFSPSTWTTVPLDTTNGRQYGAFIGYNWQWDQLVLGMDAAYNRLSSLNAFSSDTITRQVVTSPDLVNNLLTITAQSSLKLVDYATVRARAGYAMGQFLPYATIGAAVGRFNYANTVTVHNVGTPPLGSPISPFNVTNTLSNGKDNAIVGGFEVGLGMDVAVLPNVFLRGEWEFVAFAPVAGSRASMNTGRVGVGMKF